MSISNGNYIYSGTIMHRRFTPFPHQFKYKIFMMYFDVSKAETILSRPWFFRVNKPSIASFYRKDYHGDSNLSLDESVRSTVYKKTGRKLQGPIRILTHLRYFGYCFNPVSFYYCFDKEDNEVELIMAEVTNTPWQERHSYIISDKGEKNQSLTADLKKEFHVSPFWGMDHDYKWIFSKPDEKLAVNMKNFKDQGKVFDATLILSRNELNLKNFFMHVMAFPLITLRIVFLIHWQAAKLWFKGATFFTHPSKVNLNKE